MQHRSASPDQSDDRAATLEEGRPIAARDGDGSRPGRTRRERLFVDGMSAFWVLLWLVWLLEPLIAAVRMREEPRGVVGLIATVLFAVAYIGHFLRYGPRPFTEIDARRRAGAVAGQVALAVLAVICCWALGEQALATLVFTAIAGMWTWPPRVSFVQAVAFVVGTGWAMWHLPGWAPQLGTLAGMSFGLIASGLGVLAARRRRELQAARADNARLMITEERTRFSRDLHDIVGHSLTVISIKAELAERLAAVDPKRAAAEMAAVGELSRAALEDVQRAVEGYRTLSLSAELVHAKDVLGDAGIRAEVPGAADDVPADLRELFAWTIREATTNVVRHARARTCVIELSRHAVVVTDDGVGATRTESGRGLRGLRERAAADGAVLSLTQVQPHGLRLAVAVPAEHTDSIGPQDPAAPSVHDAPDHASSTLSRSQEETP